MLFAWPSLWYLVLSPDKLIQSPNPQHLTAWPYLELGS